MKNEDITILIADDEFQNIEPLVYNLKKEGFNLVTALNGVEAVAKAKQYRPDLIILDVMMPEMDGIMACQEIRTLEGFEETVIVFLTAREEDFSQIAGFAAGADDYLTKPIRQKVIVSKIQSLLRRVKIDEIIDENVVKIGYFLVNKNTYKAYYKGEELVLPRKEFELLFLLSSKPGYVFTREEILESIWGMDVIVGGRTIDVHIRKLREKLGEDYFKTIKGVGYKFENVEY
ncbi:MULTISPECIES: response regulator transcription factor [Myroides]|uniref:Response regulator n=1 Tax=Myroides albus TaxID=2562892 RepID=A0A6I3LR54_9FLAO|nr:MULTISPECIES: response regulator transcription factor [Myroides]MTG98652.1 response regulator [Myroides albus]MVX36435.1 response regulator [Myroides sp. LoEW2-1]UVD81293.1 response regulator transcription factor [Myroides albus]